MQNGVWEWNVNGGHYPNPNPNPVDEGKKLFLWRDALVLMDHSLLPEGSVSKRPIKERVSHDITLML